MDVLTDKDVERLLEWYRQNKRSLPWRDTGDPYDVLLSEIMLQQTRVEAVISSFQRFRKEVPDIASLAKLDEERLLRLWEGLGYYSRARNLKKCAQQITELHDGKIPKDQEKLLSLTGIGPYSAGAIASIAYDLPYPAIDGNVLRVMARYLGIREDIRLEEVKRKITDVVKRHYDPSLSREEGHYRDLSQAFMELGALVCLPNGKPDCEHCPFSENCYAHAQSLTDEIPSRKKGKDRKITERTILIVLEKDSFLVRRRPSKGLLAGMYEFPGLERKMDEKEVKEYLKHRGMDVHQVKELEDSQHIFSHMEWKMKAFEIKVKNRNFKLKEEEMWADRMQMQSLALPSAFHTYIDHYDLRETQ